MGRFDRIVEEAIKKAIQEGEFDNISGIGKPIQWNGNPFAPLDMRLVDDLLKKNEILYPWMEKRKEIDLLVKDLKQKTTINASNNELNEIDLSNQIEAINKKIFDYNLSVPVMRLQIRFINKDDLINQE